MDRKRSPGHGHDHSHTHGVSSGWIRNAVIGANASEPRLKKFQQKMYAAEDRASKRGWELDYNSPKLPHNSKMMRKYGEAAMHVNIHVVGNKEAKRNAKERKHWESEKAAARKAVGWSTPTVAKKSAKPKKAVGRK